MKTSTDRILTTHVGSLPRPQDVVDLLFAQDRGEPYDEAKFEETIRRAVGDTIKKQEECGVDIVSDGEMSKISYATYIRHRLTGFEGDSARPTPQDLDDYPEYRDRLVKAGHSATYKRPVCKGPIKIKNLKPVEQDIARMKEALSKANVVEGFMNAVSPGTIAVFQPNEYYPSHEKYLEALAEAMREEYEMIVKSGLLLQLDCPDLAMGRHSRFKNLSDDEFLRYAELQVEALNHALANVPADRVRLHVCWGNYEGTHINDMDCMKIFPMAVKVKPMALLIEAANPRHEHEWEAWTKIKLPEGKILVPGVIASSSNYVEHPEVVAQRILRYANVVGRERVMAGSDCGFGTFAGFGPVFPAFAWMKLKSLAEGARIASEKLWGRAGTAN
ncbi:MAG TPA: cobalamin-independent methionine synthase II family protein [Candidatus Acidoferrales bacterium]|jgi:5-methyltetrahydropteroyltriglutamate--homocysteine methyltransferase|nr:cobalamin-independent methionine synthase II family protein [Candidatus Acidoferrales bacterium]